MAPTSASFPAGPARAVASWLRLAAIWHLLLGLGALAGLVWLWALTPTAPGLTTGLLISGLLALLASLSLLAAHALRGRRHRGRTLSLGINYLLLLFSLIGSLYRLGGFAGLDTLAGNFGRVLPFLALGLVGLGVGTLGGDRLRPAQRQARVRLSRAIMAVAGVGILWTAGIFAAIVGIPGALGDPLTLGVLLLAFPTILFLWAIWRRPVADALQATNSHEEMLNGWLFLSPNLLGFLVFVAGPLLFSLYVSFTDWDAFGTRNWVGLDNYASILNLKIEPLASPDQRVGDVMDVSVYDELTRFNLFGRTYLVGAEDRLLWIALGNTLQFALMAIPLSIIPALFLANLLNSKVPGMKFFRAVYFLPSVAAVVGIALVWQWLFNATIGYINYGISGAVNLINDVFGSGVVDPQIRWLSESRTALLAVVIMSAWQWIGFNTVLFLAGLQNIPGDLYEAATVDGASPRQQFWRITIPLLAPTTFFVLVTTTIQSMQVFEQIFILIPGQNPAGPDNSTLTMVLYLYQKAFQRFEQGYASAIAWVLFILIFGATYVQFRRQRASGLQQVR